MQLWWASSCTELKKFEECSVLLIFIHCVCLPVCVREIKRFCGSLYVSRLNQVKFSQSEANSLSVFLSCLAIVDFFTLCPVIEPYVKQIWRQVQLPLCSYHTYYWSMCVTDSRLSSSYFPIIELTNVQRPWFYSYIIRRHRCHQPSALNSTLCR